MTVLTPVLIIGREPCPRLHPCPSLPSPTPGRGGAAHLIVVAPALQNGAGGWLTPVSARGVRHRLAVVLTTTVCAVAAGARSFVAVAEWVADLPDTLADTLGTAAVPEQIDDPPRRARRQDADAYRRRDRRVHSAAVHCCTREGAATGAGGGRQGPGGSRHSDRDWGTPSSARLAQLPAITAPTLVVWGGCDSLLAAHQAHTAVDLLPHGRLSVFPDCGHRCVVHRAPRPVRHRAPTTG